MTLAALFLQDEGDFRKILLALAVFLVPVLLRVGKWLLVRMGLLPPEAEEADAEQARAERARQRAERRTAEAEGEDLWRRLARGEAEAPPAAAPAPVPTPRAARVPLPEVEARSLEREEEPAPLSMLGEVSTVEEPAEAPETSLEVEAEPSPLDTLGRAAPLAAPGSRLTQPRLLQRLPQPGLRGRPFARVRGEMRRAVLYSEVLGPPVSERLLR